MLVVSWVLAVVTGGLHTHEQDHGTDGRSIGVDASTAALLGAREHGSSDGSVEKFSSWKNKRSLASIIGLGSCKVFDTISLQVSLMGDLRDRVRSAPPGTFWRVEDVPGRRSAVNTAFHRLAVDGELLRLHRGLYWKGVRSRYGSGRPSALEIGVAAAGPGAGPAGWAAGRALGLTTQLPAVPEIAVVGRPPTGVDGVRYRSRSNLERLDLRPLEVALLEILREWPRFAEADWVDSLDTVRRLNEEGHIDLERTAVATEHEPSPKARRLMRELWDVVGCSTEAA